jgi:hypothetical protein
VGAAGCGDEEGVAEGAIVRVYVEQPLCATANYEKVEGGNGAFEIRFVCLSRSGGDNQVDLAKAGANARRATEDSSTVAYLQPDEPALTRFTQPILEAAGIGWVAANTPHDGVSRLLTLIDEADPNHLRADVREALGQG